MSRSNIAGAINAAHAGVEAAKREGAAYAVECGRLLAEAKATVPHGGWDGWLRTNTVVSPRSAQLYMRIARHVEGDPAKAQRVAGFSLREAAAEAVATRRALGPKPLNPMTPDEEAMLAELMRLWEQAKGRPEWKEMFARELYRRGDITLRQRNRMIRSVYHQPGITDAERAEAGKRLAFLFKAYMPENELKALAPTFAQFTGEDLAIALGDAIEARQQCPVELDLAVSPTITLPRRALSHEVAEHDL